MSFKEFIKELDGKRIEGQLVKTFIVSLVVCALTFLLLYYGLLSSYLNFSKNGLFIILSILSISLMLPSIHQVRSYLSHSCMGGMMIGMTLGMISGFLMGFFVGATNGMFIGSLAGMIVGISLGTWLGSCCGVMGFLEGIMAGFMGGLMGAMTSIMLYNDHLKSASIIIFIISAAILTSLKYMVYNETKTIKHDRDHSYWLTIVLSVILTSIILLVISFAPKSLIVQ